MNKPLRLAITLLSAIVLFGVGSAHAGPVDKARQHYQRGNQKFEAGDYKGAMREFKSADKLAPSPILEFNIGLCHDRLGNAADAVRHYRNYLAKVPGAQNRAEVEDSIARLEGASSASEAAPPPAPADPTPRPDAGPPTPDKLAKLGGSDPPTLGGDMGEGYVYTGSDPELRRVSRIDIAAIRARYRGQP